MNIKKRNKKKAIFLKRKWLFSFEMSKLIPTFVAQNYLKFIQMKTLIEKLKALRLYFVRCSYFIWNKYFRSDKVKTQNGRIYSRKLIEKKMQDYCANQNENFGELSHPQ